MNKPILAILFIFFAININAQNINAKRFEEQPYGVIDTSDLKLKECDFEKDANAEVLFDVAYVHSDGHYFLMERHTRIKIFNDFGKNVANNRIEYLSYLNAASINRLEAQTINLDNGIISITKLEKKSIYEENIDKFNSALVFTMPNVKSGSIIEFKYIYTLNYAYFPTWYFQRNIPTRYSEIKLDLPPGIEFRVLPHVRQPYIYSNGKLDDFIQTRALNNVHSLPNEPFLGCIDDNLQKIELLLLSRGLDTWNKIGKIISNSDEICNQLDRGLNGEAEIIGKAKSLKSDYEKTEYIFDTVRNRMKWNGRTTFYSIDGTVTAWNNMIGNSAEINLILCRLLRKSGINSYPIIIGDKNLKKLNPVNPNIDILSSTLVYLPIDTLNSYILDATGKYNQIDLIPVSALNTFGLVIDSKDNIYKPIFIELQKPSLKTLYLNAEIKPDGKLIGSVEINNYGFQKLNAIDRYKKGDQTTYIKYLTENDNNVKINSLEITGLNVDSLPLTQKFNFDTELDNSSDNYLYLYPKMFTLFEENPFKSQNRYGDIDFGYKESFASNSIINMPEGYKLDTVPPNLTIITPDLSIIFKRFVVFQEHSLLIKYNLLHKKTKYFLSDYDDLKSFYLKMYDLLNEPILIKKK